MVCNTFPMLHKISFVREHQQKTHVTLRRFWSFKAVEGLSDSVKKWKFVTKVFLSDNAKWSFKNLWKMISVNVKANKNNKK